MRLIDDDQRIVTNHRAIHSFFLIHIVSKKKMFMFTGKQTSYFRHFGLDEAAETGVSDQRGRRKTAELHTSGAERAETWHVGVKW